MKACHSNILFKTPIDPHNVPTVMLYSEDSKFHIDRCLHITYIIYQKEGGQKVPVVST